MTKELYIGVMTGTSADALDIVLAEISETEFNTLDSASMPFSEALQLEIKSLCAAGPDEIDRATSFGIRLSLHTDNLIKKLLTQNHLSATQICAIGFHGQTIRHQPLHQFPYSVQAGCPSTLAVNSGITTVTDFRMADIADGGQGAPLVPAFHQFAFQSKQEDRFIVNIGGIANITHLPADNKTPIIGFDTGPGNTLLDEWIKKHLGKPYDDDGRWARSGSLIAPALNSMLSDPYFIKEAPKSTGKEYFNLDWLNKHFDKYPTLRPEDIQRTLVELTALSIANDIKSARIEPSKTCSSIYLCGGGINNSFLLERLHEHLPGSIISSTATLGIHPQLIECSAFAWLARQTLKRLPGNIPSVTGAKNKRILGGIYYA